MKVAVTGASGFIGRHVLRELSSRTGVEVVASSRADPQAARLPPEIRHVQLDIGSPSPNDYASLGCPDVLLHLAWSGLPNYRSLHHFESELPRQYAFLQSLIQAGLRPMLVTGTCFEYGMTSGELQESMPARPAIRMASRRVALYQQLQFLRSTRAFELTWARLFYMYGDGQPGTSLFPQLVAAVARGDASFGMSRGEQLRDFLPVEVVARHIVDLALRCPGAGIVNVCSGKPISVRALVEQWLARAAGALRSILGSTHIRTTSLLPSGGRRTNSDAAPIPWTDSAD